MSSNVIINFILFQVTWFSCVLGAGAYGLDWLAVIAVAAVCAHVMTTPTRSTDLTCAFAALLVGYTLDNIWVMTNILAYPDSNFAPYWLGVLWFGFGLSLNHSLKFFRDLNWFGAIIVGAFGPVTYFTAETFGVVSIVNPLQLLWVTVTWIALFRALTFYSVWHLRQNPNTSGQLEA